MGPRCWSRAAVVRQMSYRKIVMLLVSSRRGPKSSALSFAFGHCTCGLLFAQMCRVGRGVFRYQRLCRNRNITEYFTKLCLCVVDNHTLLQLARNDNDREHSTKDDDDDDDNFTNAITDKSRTADGHGSKVRCAECGRQRGTGAKRNRILCRSLRAAHAEHESREELSDVVRIEHKSMMSVHVRKLPVVCCCHWSIEAIACCMSRLMDIRWFSE